MIAGLVHVAAVGVVAGVAIVVFVVLEGRRLRRVEAVIDPPFGQLPCGAEGSSLISGGVNDGTGRRDGVEPFAEGSTVASPPIGEQVRTAHLAHVQQVGDTGE